MGHGLGIPCGPRLSSPLTVGGRLVRADIATIDALEAAVQARAEKLLESLPDATDDERRVHAVLLLATGAPDDTEPSELLPTVLLYLHLYAGSDAGPIGRLEGHGPVTEAWIHRVLGANCKVKVQPVLDIAGQAPVDAYEIPDRHRQAVHLMTPADTFSYGSSLSRKQQVDHTVPFDEGGESAVGNYARPRPRPRRLTRRQHGSSAIVAKSPD